MQIDHYPMTVEWAGVPTLWVPCHAGVRAGISAKNLGEDADVASWKLTLRSYPDRRSRMDNARN